MNTFLHDLRYGVRLLARRPGFTTVAVLALALGIGANSAIFSVIDAVLLKPLPVEEPDRLVAIYASDEQGKFGTSAYPDFIDFRTQNDVFTDMLATRTISMSLGANEQTERVAGELVTANYFSLLGVEPVLGRAFLPEEDQAPGAHPVAVISYGFWQRRFGSDRNALGREVKINGHSFTLVGVAPRSFTGLEVTTGPDLWVPMMMQEQAMPGRNLLKHRGARWLNILGRLKAGVTLEQAQAQMNSIAFQLNEAYRDTNGGYTHARIVPANQARIWPTERDDLKFYTGLLMAVVGIVLLIACANVANLLLARASTRRKEIAVRLALGASRGRLIRQLLTESALLSLLGGGVGLLFGYGGISVLSAFNLPTGMPISIQSLGLSLDARIVAFTLGLSLLTGLIFGLAPAMQATKPDLVTALKDDSSTNRPGQQRALLRNLLVVSQVSLSLVLLISAGLFIRTFVSAQAIELGFNPDNVVIMSADLRLQGYDEARGKAFHQQLIERVEALPQIESASVSLVVPVDPGGMRRSVVLEGYTRATGESLELNQNIVSSGYFKTLAIPILRGRELSERDNAEAPKVVVINEAMAERYWPGQEALGKRIWLAGENDPPAEVIGIAKNGKYRSLRDSTTPPYIYVPMLQQYESRITLAVRTKSDPASAITAVRRVVQTIDSDLPVFRIKTLREHVGVVLSQEKMAATLLSVFSLLALLLASIGIYGVISYSVTQRTREIGIRMALGAQHKDVLRLVLKQGFTLTAIGVGIGLVAAFAFTRVMSSLLYGVSASDPATFALTSLLLIAVALIATYLPARKAARVDPMIALRYE